MKELALAVASLVLYVQVNVHIDSFNPCSAFSHSGSCSSKPD